MEWDELKVPSNPNPHASVNDFWMRADWEWVLTRCVCVGRSHLVRCSLEQHPCGGAGSSTGWSHSLIAVPHVPLEQIPPPVRVPSSHHLGTKKGLGKWGAEEPPCPRFLRIFFALGVFGCFLSYWSPWVFNIQQRFCDSPSCPLKRSSCSEENPVGKGLGRISCSSHAVLKGRIWVRRLRGPCLPATEAVECAGGKLSSSSCSSLECWNGLGWKGP